VPVALARPVIVRTRGRIVITSAVVAVIIPADICARAGRFVGRIIPKARAVLVVGVAALRRFVVTETVEEYAVLFTARVGGKCGESAGIALPTNAVPAAVILAIVVAEPVLVVTSNIAAGIAGEIA